METRRRVHDGIVGIVVTLGTAAGYWVAPVWLLVPGIVGLLMIQSWVTGFCPVYWTLDKLGMRKEAPAA